MQKLPMQERLRGAAPLPVALGRLEEVDAFLGGAVDVGVARRAGFDGGIEESPDQRMTAA